jgi:hypothetical protein
LPITEVPSDWLSIGHLLAADDQLLNGIIGLGNFVR